MKSLILEVTSMRKLTTLFGDELLVLNDITFNKINHFHETKLGIAMKYH